MKRLLYRTAVAAVLVLVAATGAHAGLRCGTQLVTEGDSVLELLEYCGEPTIGAPPFFGMAEWTYDFGPHRFIKRVLIEDGRVERIERLGYGVMPPTQSEAAADRE